MSDVKWTKGPWIAFGSIPEEGVDCFWIKAQPHPAMRGFTKDIGTVDGYQDDPERSANAHLIAAAPDGAELARMVMDICGNPKGISEGEQEQLYETALQFMKKVRGETQ